MKILINGAGRIGRILTRLFLNDRKIKEIIINDPNFNIDSLEYLLKFDSIYGKLKFQIQKKQGYLIINKKKINFDNKKNLFSKLSNLKDAKIIIDSSGVKSNYNNILKISKKSNKKFLITHTYEKADHHHIFGITNPKLCQNNKVISCSICDAIATGPIINILNENLNIISANLVTLHPWLSYQNLNDGISRSFAYPGEIIENFALGRASTESLIPKTTSCIKALKFFIPNIEKKFSSMSIRVPTPVVSSAIINFEFEKQITIKKVINLLTNLQKKEKTQLFEISNEQLISKDIIANASSAVIDLRWLSTDKNKLRLFIWYDNEYGYSSRVYDLAKFLLNEKKS